MSLLLFTPFPSKADALLADVLLRLADAVIVNAVLPEHYLEEDLQAQRVRVGHDLWTVFHVVKNYTRGKGFSQDSNGVWSIEPALQSVLVTAGVRYAGQAAPGRTVKYFEDFSENELRVLHQFRVRNA